MLREENLPFEFSGKMARLLGRESVSSEIAAIFELIKNAYDSDATNVKVSFQNFSNKQEDAKIIISDNGDGMNLIELKNNWMIIGTYSKDKIHRTKKGRRVVGNKGIGRFATERLAGSMKLISKSKKNLDEVILNVNWSDYEKENITFNDVLNKVLINEKRDDEQNHGTDIILSDLRDDWNAEKIKRLRRSVASIVIPEELVPATGDKFEVIIDDPDFKTSEEKKVHSLLFKNAPFKLTANLSDKNDFCFAHLYEKNIEQDKKRIELNKNLPSGAKWKHFGKCNFTLYFYPGETRLEKWNTYYKSALKIPKIHNYLKEFCGVKIYRDGFLVRPYGEKGNDWLDLDKERVMSNLKVGNNQVISFIEISKDSSPMILDTTTRERLIENTEFESMRFYVKECINFLNDYREIENKKLREEVKKVYHENVIEAEVKYLNELLDEIEGLNSGDRKMIRHSLRTITRTFADYKGDTEAGYYELERVKRSFRNLATLGISSATSSHEIYNIMAVMGEIPKSIRIKLRKQPLDKSGIISDSKEVSDYISTIREFVTVIREFSVSVKDDYESDHEKERITLKPYLSKIFTKFENLFRRENIDIKLYVYPEDLAVYINRADLLSIILNLLTNSLKAVDLLPKKVKKQISVTIEKQAHNLKLLFNNNGPPIPEKQMERIFELFISGYKEGTGLGLPIVKEIVSDYNGKIEVKPIPEFENGTTFEIKIPWEELKK